MKRFWKVLLGVIIVLAAFLIVTCVINRWSVQVTLNGSSEDYCDLGNEYQDSGATAILTGSLFDTAVQLPVSEQGTVDISTAGDYTVTYSAGLLFYRNSVSRTVHVGDFTAPVISLTVNPSYSVASADDYRDPGYSAYDNVDGDLTDQVTVAEENGVLTYSVSDSSGNSSSVKRKIKFSQEKPTKITLVSGPYVTVYTGTDYNDAYKAVDVNDGDITENVEVEGEVDTSTPGLYELNYRVTDNDGIVTTARRYVKVVDRPGEKIIYLTFDDGPGPYTADLLDILARYDVKATFFVTNQFPEYQDMIGREAQEGHLVALHTYQHDFSYLYASTENYWNDLEAMESVIEAQTGSRTNIIRFPGGSSNRVSFDYASGIMTELTQQVTERGYYYFDWNVSSGDAGGNTTKEEVYDALVKEVDGMNTSVILCHDIKNYTVEAMPDFLQWALDNGYSFRLLDEDSFNAHHTVHN